MSIFTARRRTVKPVQTRPAVIRPVPATFGQGVLDDESPMPAGLARVLAARESEVARALPLISEALEVRKAKVEAKAKAKAKSNVTPSTLDQAWRLGYELGRMGVDANPNVVFNHRERAAFAAGHEEGREEFDREAVEAWIEDRGPWYEGSDEPWGDAAEYNLSGGLVGMMD